MNNINTTGFQDLRERLNQYLVNELIPFERKSEFTYEDKFTKATVQGIWKRSYDLGLYVLQVPAEIGG